MKQAHIDQKNLLYMQEDHILIGSIRDNMNVVLDNVGKANPSNSCAAAFQAYKKATNSNGFSQTNSNEDPNNKIQSNVNQTDSLIVEPTQLSELTNKLIKMSMDQLNYFEQTDSKFLLEKVVDISKSLGELERTIKEIRSIQLNNFSDLNAVLTDQYEDKNINPSSKIISNYRWVLKVSLQFNQNLSIFFSLYLSFSYSIY